MTDEHEDIQPVAFIEDVRARYDADGSLKEDAGVEVRVEYNLVVEHRFRPDEIEDDEERAELAEEYEPGEVIDEELTDDAEARLRYDVEDGVARLAEFKDAKPQDANWIGLEFLKALKGGERAVENLPEIERVERAEETLGEFVEIGDGVELHQA